MFICMHVQRSTWISKALLCCSPPHVLSQGPSLKPELTDVQCTGLLPQTTKITDMQDHIRLFLIVFKIHTSSFVPCTQHHLTGTVFFVFPLVCFLTSWKHSQPSFHLRVTSAFVY